MKHSSRILGLALLGAVAIINLTGCGYLRNRVNDVKDVIEVGVTVSEKPCFSAYVSGPFIQCVATAGIGYVDGYFIGLGDGRFHFMSHHYENSLGLVVWGMEEVSYEYNAEELAAMPEAERLKKNNNMQVGAAGFLIKPPGLKYMGSCPHYIHLGWVGIKVDPRYGQMIDLVTSAFLVDICLDDNRDWTGKVPEPNALKEGIGLKPSGIGTYFSRLVHLEGNL